MLGGRGTQFDAGLLDLFFGAFDDVLGDPARDRGQRTRRSGPSSPGRAPPPRRSRSLDAAGSSTSRTLAASVVGRERLAEERALSGASHDLLGSSV